MNLHEFQAKELFKDYGLPVPRFKVASSKEEALAAAKELGGSRWVAKAQVHAGGRGKAGGVKLVDEQELVEFVASMLGSNLVTYQTDSNGQPVHKILVEELSSIQNELYLGAVLDRVTSKVVIMASTEGGVEIEKVAAETPEKILRIIVDPMLGVMPFQAREVGFKLGFNSAQIKAFSKIVAGIGKMFKELDLALIEINPLVVKEDGDIICLDGKINVDENALYRQKRISAMRDVSQENAKENHAKEWELNYVALAGSIGCMVNGAGLAMATMDIIKLYGGEPANFLDVGGGATEERVKEAFKIILSDDTVKAVLVNIFGGIVKCDLIAEGIIKAVSEVGIKVPVVVRLEGNRAELAKELLEKSEFNIIAANSLVDAAEKVVQAAKE